MNTEELIQKLNEAAKRNIDELFEFWDFKGSKLLKCMQITDDPEYCLDGIHECYAKHLQSFNCEKIVDEIADRIDINDTKKISFSLGNAREKLSIIIQDVNYGRSIRIIRCGEDAYKGCVSSNDGVDHLLYNP
jgi:hypothetical protein